ncbi:hypothetical protein BGZ63DRAFT_461679 [Mariannaea sp. PMI_226]|nr:hypothetical protein BGZ63DRAFT_461679 [Mariannaea sp. PMI_226]
MASGLPVSTGGESPKPVYVGIDFGTTFSAVAFIIDHGPGHPPKRYTVPTWGDVKCGSQVANAQECSEWFKLGLLHPDYLDYEIRSSTLFQHHELFRHGLGLKVGHVATHFFKYLWEGFLKYLHDSGPGGDYVFFLTVGVPADWPLSGIHAIRKAIINAQINQYLRAPVKFVSEAEATILSVITKPVIPLGAENPDRNLSMLNVQRGDILLVCDCGGGTIDLGAYEVSTMNPLALTECVPGTCKMNGAVQLDNRFLHLLENKASLLSIHPSVKSIKKAQLVSFLRSVWDVKIKPEFHSGNKPVSVPVPGDWFKKSQKPPTDFQSIEFTQAELSSVFEPVTTISQLVEDNIRLVMKNKGKAPKYVLVCGGFGQNKFLQENIWSRVAQVSQNIGHQIETIALPNDTGLLAVCNGAAQQCHQSFNSREYWAIQINGRIARATYGIKRQYSTMTYRWFLKEGSVLWSSKPLPISLNSEDTWITLTNDQKVVLNLEISSQQGQSEPRRFCLVKWATGATRESFFNGNGGITMQPVFRGPVLSFSIAYNGVQQDPANVFHSYQDDAIN